MRLSLKSLAIAVPATLIGLAAIVAPAIADRWVLVSTAEDGTELYINESSIEFHEGGTVVSFIEEFDHPDDPTTTSYMVVAACPPSTYAMVWERTFRKYDNEMIESIDFSDDPPMSRVQYGTVGYDIISYACNY
jgi:hypothetical protein